MRQSDLNVIDSEL